jgi:integrase
MALRKPVIRLSEACDRYLERIEREGHAATTQRTTTYALTRFKKAVASRREPDPLLHTITAEMMDDYCYGRNGLRSGDRGITASTFNRYRASLKVFWDYALTMGWVDANPMRGIGPARPEAPKPKLMLSAGELIALLDSCSKPGPADRLLDRNEHRTPVERHPATDHLRCRPVFRLYPDGDPEDQEDRRQADHDGAPLGTIEVAQHVRRPDGPA